MCVTGLGDLKLFKDETWMMADDDKKRRATRSDSASLMGTRVCSVEPRKLEEPLKLEFVRIHSTLD
jgi:hypothetical protein